MPRHIVKRASDAPVPASKRDTSLIWMLRNFERNTFNPNPSLIDRANWAISGYELSDYKHLHGSARSHLNDLKAILEELRESREESKLGGTNAI